MAFSAAVYAQQLESLTIQDYGAGPASIAVYLVIGSFTAPVQDEVSAEELLIASNTGAARHAYAPMGLAGGQKISFGMIISNEENDTDLNAPSLVRALARGSVAGTGHAAETYTNQLTGGGKPMCKLVGTWTDVLGATTIKTHPCSIDKATPAVFGNMRGYQVDATLLGTITRT